MPAINGGWRESVYTIRSFLVKQSFLILEGICSSSSCAQSKSFIFTINVKYTGLHLIGSWLHQLSLSGENIVSIQPNAKWVNKGTSWKELPLPREGESFKEKVQEWEVGCEFYPKK